MGDSAQAISCGKKSLEDTPPAEHTLSLRYCLCCVRAKYIRNGLRLIERFWAAPQLHLRPTAGTANGRKPI